MFDKGYYKAKDLKRCTDNGIAIYITKQVYSNGTKDKAFYTDQFKWDVSLLLSIYLMINAPW